MIKHCTCEACLAEFDVSYDEEDLEDSPGFCPFCGEKLFLDDEFVFMSEEDDFDGELNFNGTDINDDMDS